MNIKHFLLFGTIMCLFTMIACKKDHETIGSIDVATSNEVFTILSPQKTGIEFSNSIQEDNEINYWNFVYVYNEGGVAMRDLNNDGLPDLYFSGNQVPNKLYLNKGNFEFEDITAKAGVAGDQGWHTGVSMIDINNDGLLDIYACKSSWKNNPEARKNQLFINKGDMKFEESAAVYGLADNGFSIQACFFDYDNDGDLDMYLMNHPYEFELPLEERLARRNNPPSDAVRDKLYRNNGTGAFTEVSKAAGIFNYGHGLGVAAADLNDDGFKDLYIANDFKEPDYFYMNNGDGTFTDKLKEQTNHIAFYSMGVDVADINNDGWEDIFTVEMLPADYVRSKTTMAPMNTQLFEGMVDLGLHYQYMHNALQLNRGNGHFSEIAQIAGMAKTDWSWACLISDFDNDSFKDVFVTNGNRRDLFDNDFRIVANQKAKQKGGSLTHTELTQMMPAVKVANYVFQNQNGSLKFVDKTKDWGIDQKTWSHGAAVGDLDGDGDLDLVCNNMEEPAFIYKNNTVGNNFLRIKLNGPAQNKNGIGAQIWLRTPTNTYFQELKTVRGYESSSEGIAHFGLGTQTSILDVRIKWFNDQVTILKGPEVNQLLSLDFKDAQSIEFGKSPKPLLKEASQQKLNPVFKHQENKHNDFRKQILLPHKLSQLGPFIATGDINGDGREDFFIGGAYKQAGQIYIQTNTSEFKQIKTPILAKDASYEDMGAEFFDADGDGDLDLYVVSGGTEFEPKSIFYQDRLYINDGKGNFGKGSLPQILSSGSCVKVSDYDKDGDLDLFIGGRVFPDHYPYPTPSYILRNDDGIFKDIGFEIAPELVVSGMVTDAVWTDLNNDDLLDLIVVGEWMEITPFIQENGKFEKATTTFGLENTRGWWNTIEPTDIDDDGDLDYLVGNLGLNHKFHASEAKPFHVYCSDFDQNGSMDIVLAKYNQDQQVPVRGKECSSEQMPFVAEKFPTYNEFATSNIQQMLGDGLEKALHYEANIFESILLLNNNGRFEMVKLPNEAQIAPINGFVISDFDGDTKKEVLLAGNMFQTEVETSRADASVGLILRFKAGTFQVVPVPDSGFFVPNDVKDVQSIAIDNGKDIAILVAANNDKLKLFTRNE